MELREALAQISHIRQQMARAEVFRGYRSLTVGCSGVLALLAGIAQAIWLPNPTASLEAYLTLWLSVAVLNAAVCGAGMWIRARASGSALVRQMTLLAVEQFTPCLVAGGLLTAVVVIHVPHTAWMLPGLWAILFSLGVFASFRLLPRAVFWVGAFYLVAGILCLAFGRDGAALSPWTMGPTFGIGQLLAAATLYWTLERHDEKNTD